MNYEDRYMEIEEDPSCKSTSLGSGIPVLELNDLDLLHNDTRSFISEDEDGDVEWEASDIFLEGKPVPRRLIRSQNSNPTRPKTAEIMRELRETHVISSQKSSVTMTPWESCDRGAVFAHKPPYHLDQLNFELEKRKLLGETGRNESLYLPPVAVRSQGIEPWWKRTQNNIVSQSESDHVTCSSPNLRQVQAVASEPSCDDKHNINMKYASRKKTMKQNRNRSERDPVIFTDSLQNEAEGQTNIRITIEQKNPEILQKTGNKSPKILLKAKEAMSEIKSTGLKSKMEIYEDHSTKELNTASHNLTDAEKCKKQSNKKRKQRRSRDAGTEI